MALAALVLTGGLVTLWGWVGLDAGRHSLRDGASGPGGRLVDWFGDGISMKANAAVTAAALAGAVLLGQLRRGRLARWIALALAVGAGAIGAATLLQHVAGWELGIDGLLAKEFPGARATSAPGRMGLPASTSFTLVGAAAAVAIWRRATASPALLRRSGRLAVGLTVIVCIIASASLLGHLYGADTMFAIPGLTGIAVQTASMLLALGVAVLCTLEDRSPVRVLVDPGTGGLLARRAIAVVVLLPVVLGHLRTLGERAGYFDAPTGRALLILSLIGLLLWLLFGSAAVIRRREQRALAAERAGDVRYRMLFNSIDQGFCIVEVDFEG
ncbi:MAG TPA: hypothetical protein VFF65_13700, partial [Phycisphaerales bacterium]|nr:hypothetical protein [Phycisphaerales bacterium]